MSTSAAQQVVPLGRDSAALAYLDVPGAPDETRPEDAGFRPTPPVVSSSDPRVDPGAPPAVFAAFLAAGEGRRRISLRRRLTYGLSLSLHMAALLGAGAYSFWRVEEITPPRVGVSLLVLPVSPAPPPPPAPKAAAPRPKTPRPVVSPPPELTQPRELTATPPSVEPEETAVADEPGVESPAQGGQAGGVAGGVPGNTVSVAPPAPPRVPELSAGQRQMLLRRYAQEIFRTRIAAHRRYPPEAERMGLEGTVQVRVSVDRSGRLVALRLLGACAHEVLCEAAQRAVRDSAPFPAPPSELGALIEVDVPFNYKLR